MILTVFQLISGLKAPQYIKRAVEHQASRCLPRPHRSLRLVLEAEVMGPWWSPRETVLSGDSL